jgi:hypothetical protein
MYYTKYLVTNATIQRFPQKTDVVTQAIMLLPAFMESAGSPPCLQDTASEFHPTQISNKGTVSFCVLSYHVAYKYFVYII